MNQPKHTIIIAEAGVNHNGDLKLAKRLIDVAGDSGVDYVKFQTFKADSLVLEGAEKANYQKQATDLGQSQFEMLKSLELSLEMHTQLLDHCNQVGVKFLSTGFDIDSIQLLIDLGLDILKIPSGEITNVPYLRYIAAAKKQVILSTGMATLAEVSNAVDILEHAGLARELISILHCTTVYPAPMNEINLKVIPNLRAVFGLDVGYSDHTLGVEASIAAVALGATIIEKHFTLDRSLPGPDHRASLEPNELKEMVKSIRNIELAMGDGIKRPSESEYSNINAARKSIVAKRDIKKNEIFTHENIEAKRPGGGISAASWDLVIGVKAPRNFHRNELIKL